MNPRSDEELKARRQARRSERGQRLILMFGALLTVAALGVGAAIVLEARAVPSGSGGLASGVVTIAAPSFAGAGSSKPGAPTLSTDARRKLRADVFLDASTKGSSGEMSVRRVGGTEVAILRLAKRTVGKKGLPGARELVLAASDEADLVVVVLEGVSRYGSVAGAVKKGTNLASFAHGLIDAGADLVVARGRISVGGLEWYKGRLIAYELGNSTDDEAGTIAAPDGVSGVLRITLTPAGSWIDGRVLSMDADGAGGAKPDATAEVFSVLRAQSRAHFGPSAVRVERSGSLRPPTSEHA